MKNTVKFAKSVMIMGTMSSAGKSFVTAGLCRIFHQDGYRTAPFKSQNMALNSYITKDCLEMGRAQVMQAEAAGILPDVRMNPILLKPTSEKGSQIIVNGKVFDSMTAKEYYQHKQEFVPVIQDAYESLAQEYDVIVLEGAGSPAEINLKQVDIVNMGMAEISGSPVILVGDIDRGGVFASLYGTIALLDEHEKKRIKGMIINKFRGDPEILEPGLKMLEDLTGIPILGVLPYTELDLDDEDSLSERFFQSYKNDSENPAFLDIAVIKFPRISNFTDFKILESIENISVRYVSRLQELQNPDLIILPGTKNTIADLLWMRQNGLEAEILKAYEKGTVIFGICGGYQMLGKKLSDPDQIEQGGEVRGMGLCNRNTIFRKQKRTIQIQGNICDLNADFQNLAGITVTGYEIHTGETHGTERAFLRLTNGETDGCFCVSEHAEIFGTYLHGIFDNQEFTEKFLNDLIQKKHQNQQIFISDIQAYKELQYNQLADLLRKHLDMSKIYQILESGGES
ncbi:MAG: cobyric acid synthase [Oscillospiraceae bacterium]|nr:cobyric acid synthase [Oscillospiraceae bacterium]